MCYLPQLKPAHFADVANNPTEFSYAKLKWCYIYIPLQSKHAVWSWRPALYRKMHTGNEGRNKNFRWWCERNSWATRSKWWKEIRMTYWSKKKKKKVVIDRAQLQFPFIVFFQLTQAGSAFLSSGTFSPKPLSHHVPLSGLGLLHGYILGLLRLPESKFQTKEQLSCIGSFQSVFFFF